MKNSRQRAVFSAFVFLASTLAFSTASAAMVKKAVEYKDGGKTYEGYIAYNDEVKEPRPGVLVVHNWMGVSDETKKQADRLAELGYVAFAVDVYGKGVRPTNGEEAAKLATQYKNDRKLLRSRLEGGLKALRSQSGVDKKKIGAIGYCFGGTAALELARTGADLRGVVTFHGGLDSPNPADGKKIKARILALHGADDPFVPATDLAAFEDEMRKAKVDWELVKYGNAVHSFTEVGAGNDNSKGAAYNEKADKRSWEEMKRFFAETL